MKADALQRAGALFPGWVVGWWEFGAGRCGVEVTRRWYVAGQRLPKCARRTFAGSSWGEVLGELEGTTGG